MPTREARRITLEWHKAEGQARARLWRELRSVFDEAWDSDRIESSTDAIAARFASKVLEGHKRSADRASQYMVDFRAEMGVDSEELVHPPQPSDDKIRQALSTAGRVAAFRALRKGMGRREASSRALTRIEGTGSNVMLSGGRETVHRSVDADPKAIGYARAPEADACEFCAMLAGRGPVYTKETAGFEAHTNCMCEPEPLYESFEPFNDTAKRAAEIYDQFAKGEKGSKAQLAAFRRAWRAEPGGWS